MIPIPIGPFHVISLEPRWDIPLLTPTTGSGQLREFGVVVVYGGEYYFLTNQPHFNMLWIYVGSGWVVGQWRRLVYGYCWIGKSMVRMDFIVPRMNINYYSEFCFVAQTENVTHSAECRVGEARNILHPIASSTWLPA